MIVLSDITWQDGYYGIIVNKGEFTEFMPLGVDFCIHSVFKNFEDNKKTLLLIADYYGEEIRYFLPRSELNYAGISKLQGAGFDIRNPDLFSQLVTVKEEEYFKKHPLKCLHHGIGWDILKTDTERRKIKNADGYVFKFYGLISDIKSKYDGSYDIKPRGKLKGQLDFVKSEIVGYTPCETILAIGLSAVVTGLIRDRVHTTNPIVHLYGDSSIGKTTAAMLAVSTAGIPDIQSTSLFMGWNATTTAIILRLKSNCGMPVALDEISTCKESDLSSMVYILSDGKDKDRATPSLELRKNSKEDTFRTTIISTGEASLLNRCKNNTGLKVRVIELSVAFTKDAEHADRIKNGCLKNCGWLVPKLAMHMQNKGIDYVISKYSYWRNEYISHMKNQTLADRISGNYAIILTAAELANEAFGFVLNLEEMLTFLVENETDNSSDRNLADVAHEKLIEFARSHYGHFTKFYDRKIRAEKDNGENTFVYGRIDEGLEKKVDGKTVTSEFCFLSSCFPEITSKLGFEDSKIVLRKLKDSGYLNHEAGKLYRKRKLRDKDSTTSKMYVIYDFAEYESDEYQDTFTEIEDFENPFEE